jgi:hypothetical protein
VRMYSQQVVCHSLAPRCRGCGARLHRLPPSVGELRPTGSRKSSAKRKGNPNGDGEHPHRGDVLRLLCGFGQADGEGRRGREKRRSGPRREKCPGRVRRGENVAGADLGGDPSARLQDGNAHRGDRQMTKVAYT